MKPKRSLAVPAALTVTALALAAGLALWPRAPTEPPVTATSDDARPVPLLPQETPTPPVAPAHDADPVPAGKRVRIGLSEPPATWFLRGETTGNERFYRGLVAEIAGKDAFVSADLGRAAREFVFQYTELGREPPTDVRDFLIRASGAVAGDTAFQHVRTSSDTAKALRTAISALLKDPPDGDGRLVVGVGEVFTPARKTKRHIGVVATHLPALLEPLPRRIEPGDTWRLRGRLLAEFRGLKALVTLPDGSNQTLDVTRQGRRFDVRVAAGDQVGRLAVQLVGEGPRGPGKLLQVEAEVGRPLPTSYLAQLPPSERDVTTATAAAKLGFRLLNADRRQHGLPPLTWDSKLAAVAEDHSRDMRDNHFFSHRSPTTGMHPARLARAGYKSTTSAENLALNVSIHEAEAGLMHSLGHRRNILHKRVTHVGVGVVGEERESGQKRWWLTQLFAKPVEQVDPTAAANRVLRAITEARAEAGHGPLLRDSGLQDLANEAAQSATDGDLNGVTGRALSGARERGLLRGRLRAWAATTPELDQLQLPAMVREAKAKRVGVGVAQAESGIIGLVLLVGQ